MGKLSRPRRPPWLPLLLLPGAAACAPGDSLADLQVTDATIRDVHLFSALLVGGVDTGGATLDVGLLDGSRMDVPVTLAGPRLGFLFEVAYSWSIVDWPLLPAFHVGEEGLSGADLLGTYTGFEYGGEVVAGIHYGVLTNEAGMTLPLANLGVGVGADAGMVWLTMAEATE